MPVTESRSIALMPSAALGSAAIRSGDRARICAGNCVVEAPNDLDVPNIPDAPEVVVSIGETAIIGLASTVVMLSTPPLVVIR